MQMQTANKMFREYKKTGGTLSFRGWIEREKEKGFQNFTGATLIPVNKPLTDSLNRTLAQLHPKVQTKLENKYILGVDRNYWIIGGVTLIAVGGIMIYSKYHKQ